MKKNNSLPSGDDWNHRLREPSPSAKAIIICMWARLAPIKTTNCSLTTKTNLHRLWIHRHTDLHECRKVCGLFSTRRHHHLSAGANWNQCRAGCGGVGVRGFLSSSFPCKARRVAHSDFGKRMRQVRLSTFLAARPMAQILIVSARMTARPALILLVTFTDALLRQRCREFTPSACAQLIIQRMVQAANQSNRRRMFFIFNFKPV